MAAQVTPILAAADPAANPTSLVDLVAYLNTLFETVNVSGGPFTPYVISSTTPLVSDQDKVWFKVDANGRPLGEYLYYNGNWRKKYTGNPNEMRIFRGDPSLYFDGTGLGTVGGEWDGWAICNGQNGTDNWSNLFPVFGQMDNAGSITGYSGGHWNTGVSGGATQTGGTTSYKIQNTDLPNMTINITGSNYSAGAATGIKRVLVDGDHGTRTDVDTQLADQISFGAKQDDSNRTLVPTLPPYKAVCICQFIGYA